MGYKLVKGNVLFGIALYLIGFSLLNILNNLLQAYDGTLFAFFCSVPFLIGGFIMTAASWQEK